MLPPVGLTQCIEEELYIEAAVLASKKTGVLRFTAPVVTGCAAFITLGVWLIARHVSQLPYLLTGGVSLVVAAWGLLLWFLVVTPRVKAAAKADFAVYRQIYGKTRITFTADDMELAGEMITRRVVYAQTRLCVETARYYLVFADDGTTVLLLKSAFEEAPATDAFLRDVFARWFVKVR